MTAFNGCDFVSNTREELGELKAWSPKMRDVLSRIRRIAKTDLTVLITGPSGAGKELIARAIHTSSTRAAEPFLALNCGALSANLIEGELFGHTKGSFTGATEAKEGAFEACRDGTLFLDEIGELPLELQPKLLRVLETGTVRRIGGNKEIAVNTRVVAATHRNLRDLVARGLFREDLYHRLMVLDVFVPPLAERPEDILALARHFLGGRELTREAEQALLAHNWPGNVRELRNTILRATVLSDSQVIDVADLGLREVKSTPVFAQQVAVNDDMPLTVRHDEQRARFVQVLRECGNNRAEAARRLGVSRSTFHAQLKRVGLPLKFQRD